MPAAFDITIWHWTGFIVAILFFLALDLGVFHREAHSISVREAFTWTTIWFVLAMAFAYFLVRPRMGPEMAVIFVTGYVTELSLSMDNVFVIALIFTYFRVPAQYQHRILFWGILGALVMRGVMIWAGAALVDRFHWMLYVFGAFLIYTGIKMITAKEDGIHPDQNPVVALARKFFPVTSHLDGSHFTTRINGRLALTPLALVLVMVETTDLVFAVDSIPAIFGLTTNPFIVFTSNVFAILGLRSLYFVLSGLIDYFRFLKFGLALVLVFIGLKMLLDPHSEEGAGHGHRYWFQVEIPSVWSLGIVGGIIGFSILGSVLHGRLAGPAPDEKKE
jgi:tellurite resistance protein TerC